MILKIYITGVICGLLFPGLESLALRYSKCYKKLDQTPQNKYVRQYRALPEIVKLVAAIIPVFNLLWVWVIILLARFFLQNWWYARKKAIIWWLAGTSIKKHFIFKVKLVKRFFPMYKDYFYHSLEKRHWNYKLAKDIDRIILTIAVAATMKKEENEKYIKDALAELPEAKTESDGTEGKS